MLRLRSLGFVTVRIAFLCHFFFATLRRGGLIQSVVFFEARFAFLAFFTVLALDAFFARIARRFPPPVKFPYGDAVTVRFQVQVVGHPKEGPALSSLPSHCQEVPVFTVTVMRRIMNTTQTAVAA
ncbi:hypothetical protein ABH972_005417 [Bradyrhizobium ottawaense]